MVLADVINATAYDEEEFEYGVAATFACILAGAVFTFLFLAGGHCHCANRPPMRAIRLRARATARVESPGVSLLATVAAGEERKWIPTRAPLVLHAE